MTGHKVTTAVRLGGLLILMAVIIAGCGEGRDNAYQRGYEEGYDTGQHEVCRELKRIAPAIKDKLRNCRGV